ncbi:MAG: hypothetical protein HYZ93_00240 [Candidatus Omnitrophica bacterium]|nr:hypothetical protein [Candidatus Omnitrophota bacterium]
MKAVVTYVPAGSGHQRAAEAIHQALTEQGDSTRPTLLDALDGADAGYRWAFTRGYLNLIDRNPLVWSLLYHLTDLSLLSRAVQLLHRLNNRWHGRGLEKILLDERPDAVVATHFFPAEVASHLKSRGGCSFRLITVITDYLPHALWIAPGVDAYAVASPQSREALIRRGVPPERIHVLGIPIHPRFAGRADRIPLAHQLGLDPERFTLLIGSGGAGTGPVTSIVASLDAVRQPIQILVVAGKNAALFESLEKLRARIRHPIKVYGFIDNMDELMDVSDLIITKPGGLTCAEALAKGLPLFLTAPIPGQESRNARLLEEMGTAVWIRRIKEIPQRLSGFLETPQRLERLRQKAREAARPQAALEIARLASRS